MENKELPSFLGQGWKFPPRFDAETKVLAPVGEEDDIRQSLHILFHTEPGERVMNPEYGCALRQFLFEKIELSRLTQMQEVINRAILRFEPRITAESVQINTEQQLDGIVVLEVSYTIRSLNSRHKVVFPFYLIDPSISC